MDLHNGQEAVGLLFESSIGVRDKEDKRKMEFACALSAAPHSW